MGEGGGTGGPGDGGPVRLWAAPGAVFQLGADGAFTGQVSVSAAPVRGLSADHLRVFAACAQPRSAAELAAELDDLLDPADTAQIADALLLAGLLRVHGLPSGVGSGFADLHAQLPMVADLPRMRAYADAIRRAAPGRAVAELGCGAGLLSLVAARAGARSVWSVEEADVIELAAEIVADNGAAGRLRLQRGDARELDPPEPVEVLIHELFGVDPFDEGLLQTLGAVRDRWLAPGGRLLPHAFSVHAQLVALPAPGVGPRLDALSGELGLELGALRRAAPGGLHRRPGGHHERPAPAHQLSPPVPLLRVDLHGALRPPAVLDVELPVVQAGRAAALLTWFDVELDERAVLSTGPGAPPTHWGWLVHELLDPVDVAPGQRARLRLELGHREAELGMAVTSFGVLP